jgi:deoxyribonuclease-4
MAAKAGQEPPVRPVAWTVPRRPLGAHMSIAGGMERAIERAAAVGCAALQVFVKSSNQWAARPLAADEPARFRDARAASGIGPIVAHDSYLINLATPDDALFEKSIAAYVEEMRRCDALGIESLITHPGSHVGKGSEYGVRRIAEAIDEIHRRLPETCARVVLETMAGQGGSVGTTFEELAGIIAATRHADRIGICLDTCHVFAAGYDIRTPRGWDETMRRLDGTVGLDRLRAVHLNDSKKGLGCRVDRHEHIGRGHLGLEAFRLVMNDPRLAAVPLILETPKGDDCREDVENMTTLLGLVGAATVPAGMAAAVPAGTAVAAPRPAGGR